jgi:Ca2+-binding RTX toxin-like protein
MKGGSLDEKLYGNSGKDKLYGNGGNDLLDGGSGSDALYGGTGKDTFVFDTAPHKTRNVDTIYDFKSRDDSIWLDNAVFTKLGRGSTAGVKFKSDMFVENSKAKDWEDRIVYDKKTGALHYDQDGTGSKAQVKIATISNKTKLYYHDFFVI